MNARTGSWAEFDKRRQGEPPAPVDSDESILHARLFGSRDGQDWLALMRADKFGRSLDPNISNEALRHLEGQRQMLRDIDRATAAGMEQLKRNRQTP